MNNIVESAVKLTESKKEPIVKERKERNRTRVIQKRERVPLEDQRRMMSVPKDPSFEYRFVNDTDNRIEAFEKAGWSIVDRSGGEIEPDKRIQNSNWRQSAACQPVGSGITAYVMRIPKEWYNEDQLRKQRKIDHEERNNLRKQIVGSKTGDGAESFYGDIKIDHK
jgi:hypothetical protein